MCYAFIMRNVSLRYGSIMFKVTLNIVTDHQITLPSRSIMRNVGFNSAKSCSGITCQTPVGRASQFERLWSGDAVNLHNVDIAGIFKEYCQFLYGIFSE